MVVDSSAGGAIPLVLDGASWWVTDHVSPGGDEREIRIMHERNGSPVVAGRFPNPYGTPFRAAALSASKIVLSGARLEDSAVEGVVTLLLHFDIQCIAGGGRATL
jgi:hypothetical protein